MAKMLFIAAVGLALEGCASLGGAFAVRGEAAEPSRPAAGLWAILDPGCHKPSQINTRRWPRCASPVWLNDRSAWVVRVRPGRDGRDLPSSYRADLRLIAGDPLIARAGTPRDGYLFLVLDKVDRDDKGRMIDATGAVFGCRGDTPGPISLKPTAGGCEAASTDGLRRSARLALQNRASLSRVAWIAPGTP